MVYLHLHRIYPRVRYYLTGSRRQEVDFLVSDDRGAPVLAVQVSMDIGLPDTLKRELDPLIATAAYFGTRENLIITMGQEQRFERDGVTVNAVPAWRWLLEGRDDAVRERWFGARADGVPRARLGAASAILARTGAALRAGHDDVGHTVPLDTDGDFARGPVAALPAVDSGAPTCPAVPRVWGVRPPGAAPAIGVAPSGTDPATPMRMYKNMVTALADPPNRQARDDEGSLGSNFFAA